MASSMETIQKILQETVAPGISDIRERLARVEVEIKRLDDKVDSFRNETASEFRRLDNRIDSTGRTPLFQLLHFVLDHFLLCFLFQSINF